jgi:hypothetical protein
MRARNPGCAVRIYLGGSCRLLSSDQPSCDLDQPSVSHNSAGAEPAGVRCRSAVRSEKGLRVSGVKKPLSLASQAEREAVVQQLVAGALRARIRNDRRLQDDWGRLARLGVRLGPVEDEKRRDCPERDPDKEGDAHPDAEGSAHGRSTLAPFGVERVYARRDALRS